ncbi:MAG: hypothetical protein WD942_10815 [Dehalococcoidia bacterium]
MNRFAEATWGAAQIGLHLALSPVLYRRRRRWGATDAEIARSLPGDELVPDPEWSYNHAITIRAPRSAVWPWLLQLGQDRGGFYSYEPLENLVGCDIHNVYRLRPELQSLKVGDTIRMHASGFGPQVLRLLPEEALVLGGEPDLNGSQASWAFYLFDGHGRTTRLLERGRAKAGRGLTAKLGYGPYLMDPVGFVMSKKMLRRIRSLAEGQPATADKRRSTAGDEA